MDGGDLAARRFDRALTMLQCS
ncbi:hypothetical protein [Pontivivens ytuae]